MPRYSRIDKKNVPKYPVFFRNFFGGSPENWVQKMYGNQQPPGYPAEY